MDRYERQADIVPQHDSLVTVIGVGAIGRQCCLQLASIGTKNIQIVDFDVVEETNIVTQGYTEQDLGQLKVVATRDRCKLINSQANILPITDRFKRNLKVGEYIFCCVDSIDTRKMIFDSVKEKIMSGNVKAFFDARMTAEVLRVFSVNTENKDSISTYENSLFPESEAEQGRCTARATIYCANIAAGFMVSAFTKALRNIPTENDILINLLTNEFMVNV